MMWFVWSCFRTMATLHFPQARVFAMILMCLAPSLAAFGEQKSSDGPAGCAPLLAATRDARAAHKELSSLLQVTTKDSSVDAKKLNRTLFFASKRWVGRLRVQIRRALRECSLPEGLLTAYLRGGGAGEEEEEGRGERRENEVGIGSGGEWKLQVLSQNPDKAHKRETDPEERALERERGRDAASEARREMLTMASNYRGRGVSERSLAKLLAKILALETTLEEQLGGGDSREPAFEDDPRPRLEIDEVEFLHEVPRTFLSLALGSSLIQHQWKKFHTKYVLVRRSESLYLGV
ncbi:uncharacterized protein LOC134776094 [Penaeus indicus]|uniref:uncharacterized protein LOC134776094 n=1 Tax=Penaeus indicus TaxID=29960 RepID=UPI00300CEEC9